MAGSPRAFELDTDDSPMPDVYVMVDHPTWPRARKVRLDKLVRAGQTATTNLADLIQVDPVVGPTVSPYVAEHRDLIPCVTTAGVVEIRLPPDAGIRQWVKVFDLAGLAGEPNAIKVMPQSGDTVLGQSDHFLIDLPYGELYVVREVGSTAWVPKED